MHISSEIVSTLRAEMKHHEPIVLIEQTKPNTEEKELCLKK